MSSRLAKLSLFTVLSSIAAISQAQTIDFQSGNGVVGGLDSQITVFTGNQTQDFSTLTPADFAAAKNGVHASILSSLANGWVNGLGGNSTAKWVGPEATAGSNNYNSESALYAINFTATTTYTDATLNLTFSVDDSLGQNNQGIYLDGNAVANSTSFTDWNNQIENKSFDLGLVTAGTHTLYFDVVNGGNGPSGIIFSGQIGATPASTPEPATYAVFGLGLLGLFASRRNKRA